MSHILYRIYHSALSQEFEEFSLWLSISFYHCYHSVLTSPSSPLPKGPDSVRAVTAAVPWSSSANTAQVSPVSRDLWATGINTQRHVWTHDHLQQSSEKWMKMRQIYANAELEKNKNMICPKMVPQTCKPRVSNHKPSARVDKRAWELLLWFKPAPGKAPPQSLAFPTAQDLKSDILWEPMMKFFCGFCPTARHQFLSNLKKLASLVRLELDIDIIYIYID